jgi:predicted enzyme related to lactoylglutathione lyase
MPGNPIVHLELSTHDRVALGNFYAELFGWKVQQDDQLNYTTFEAQEGFGGGFNPINETNPAGTTVAYIGVEDIETTLARIEERGGKTLVPKTEIPGFGWFALFADLSGNTVGLYTAMQP